MPETNLAKVSTSGTIVDGNPWQFGFHLIHDPTYGDFDLQALLDGMVADTGYIAALRAMISSDSTLDTIEIGEVPDPSVPEDAVQAYVHDMNSSGTRTISTPPAALELCAVVTFKTGYSGRRWHGRFFAPPCRSTANQTGEGFTTGSGYYPSILSYRTELDKFREGESHDSYAAGYDLTVYSRAASLAAASPIHRRVQSIVVTNRQHWLRSRGQ
jgi:hypothetical protein